MADFTAAYALCDTAQSAMDAVVLLSRSRYLILDCEGRNLGCTDGAISLISVGTENAERIFLFDAITLTRRHPAMESLMRLLGDARVRKVMWDGRQDFLEISDNYGTDLDGVLDLQVAEVVSRSAYRGERERQRKRRLAMSQFGRKDVRPHVYKYSNIQLMLGMQACLDEHKLGTSAKKDSEIVAMHRAGGSGLWMERPLPAQLLQYAANDIFLLSRLYNHFLDKNWIREAHVSYLFTQCKRYVSMHKEQGRTDESDYFRRGPLLPIDILSIGPLAHGECMGCGRRLSRDAYETETWLANGKPLVLRRTRCRRCHVVAIQKRLPADDRWTEV